MMTDVISEPADAAALVENCTYAHGAFFGIGPRVCAEDRFLALLQQHFPDEEWHDALPVRAFENNPVIAAIGQYLESQQPAARAPRAVEWDIYLDSLVELEAVEALASVAIGHGSTFQISLEFLGWPQFNQVLATSTQHGGGVDVLRWLSIYASCIGTLFGKHGMDELKSGSDLQIFFAETWPEIFSTPVFEVVLDIKSRAANCSILQKLTKCLNSLGIKVQAIGSFDFKQTHGVASMVQLVGEKEHEGPTPVNFFHFEGDMQQWLRDHSDSCAGSTCMFNVGNLLDRRTFEPDAAVLKQIAEWKTIYRISVGVYVQEDDLCKEAAKAVIDMCNRYATVFDFGFAWGYANGTLPLDDAARRQGTGLGSQKWIGRSARPLVKLGPIFCGA